MASLIVSSIETSPHLSVTRITSLAFGLDITSDKHLPKYQNFDGYV